MALSFYIQKDRKGGEGTYEHRLLAEKALGRRLKYPEEIHHINEDKRDNSLENLVICPNRLYHKLLHIRFEALRISGDVNKRICCSCKKYDFVENMHEQRMKNKGKFVGSRFYHNFCNTEYHKRMGQKRRALYV